MFGKIMARRKSPSGPGRLRPSRRLAARTAAVFMSVCVAFTMIPTPVFAVTPDRAAETGSCEHHQVHTAECGYQEADPGQLCEHEHTAECYTDELICGLIEDADATATDSDAGHVHTQDCFGLDCSHERGEHDESCGYIEAVEGNKPELVQPDDIKIITVIAFDELDEAVQNQSVKAGTTLEELVLPDTLSAIAQTGDGEPEPVEIGGVAWEPDMPYEGAAGQTYTFTASAKGYVCEAGVDWPAIQVTIEEGAAVPGGIDALCAAIDALPTVEKLYENAPGDADLEFGAWVTETSAELRTVPALWEQFLALSGDPAAMEQITQARAEKLAALHNLAERMGERLTFSGDCIEVLGSGNQSKGSYTSLGDAISHAESGDTLKVLEDITDASAVTITDKDLTLNLQDKTISFNGGPGYVAIVVTGTASLMVEGTGTLSLNKVSSNILIINKGSGKVTIRGGTFSGSGSNGSVLTNYSIGSIDIEGGIISSTGYERPAIVNGGTGKVSITAGTVSAERSDACAIQNNKTGKVTVSGDAKITSKNTSEGTIYLAAVPDADPKTVLEVTGGTVENTADSGYAVYFKDGIGVITGNLDDYFTHTSGTITGGIHPKPKVPAPGGVIKSDTAAESIPDYFGGAAMVEGNIITLTGSVKLTDVITFESGSWILDLKDYDLNASEAYQVKAVGVTGGELTIRGTGGIIGSDLGPTMSADPSNRDPYGRAVLMTGGKLTLEDSVSLTGGKGDYIGTDAIRAKNATVVIKGNASLTGGAGPVLGNGFGLQAENCTVAISGSPVITGAADQHGIFLKEGSITISDTPAIRGGTGSYDSSIGLYVTDGGTAVISGGTFTGDDTGLFVQEDTSSVTLSGGTYRGGLGAIAIERSTALTVVSFLGNGYVYAINDQLIESSQIQNKKSIGAANENVTVKPVTLPAITTHTLPSGTVGTEYSQTLAADGTAPVTWSKESGNLPDGLILDSSGTITGTPTVSGTFTFTVKAENIAGSNTKELSIRIAALTYTINGMIKGSDTESGIAATLQLKDSQNMGVGTPVTAGADGSYRITGVPAGTYHIEVICAGYDSGIINGIVVSDGDLTGRDLTLQKTAAPITTHTITASAGSGGTISPNGTVTVNEGENQTFTIIPDSKYSIFRVVVDGADKGAVNDWTFEHVIADHSISVTFLYIGGGSSGGDDGSSSGGGGSSSSGSSSSTPSTITGTTTTENGGSVTTTTTTSADNGGKKTTVTTEVKKDAAGNVTGSGTTVMTDNITIQSGQGNAGVTVSPDGAAINSAARAAGASAQNPADISVAVPQEVINNEVLKPDVNLVQVNVILPKSVKDNPAVHTVGVTIKKETVEAARQSGKRVEVTVREETGKVESVWSLDGQTMGNAAGQATDLNLGIRMAPVQSSDPIAEPVKPPVTAEGHENGLVLSITADGTLLSSAKLTVPATNQTGITAESAVATYRFDPNTGALTQVPGGIYIVDANGNVTIDIPAGPRTGAKETYVLLPVPAAP